MTAATEATIPSMAKPEIVFPLWVEMSYDGEPVVVPNLDRMMALVLIDETLVLELSNSNPDCPPLRKVSKLEDLQSWVDQVERAGATHISVAPIPENRFMGMARTIDEFRTEIAERCGQ